MYRYQASASSRSGWPFSAGASTSPLSSPSASGTNSQSPAMARRRLLIRRLELLALGGVLVDLTEYLVPVRDQLQYTTSDLVFHHRSPIWIRRPLNEHESVVVR